MYKWKGQTGVFSLDNFSYASSVTIDQPGGYCLQVTQQLRGTYCADRSWAIEISVDTNTVHRPDTLFKGEILFVQGQSIREAGFNTWVNTASGTCLPWIRAWVTVLPRAFPIVICRQALAIDLNEEGWSELPPESIILEGNP